MNYRPLAFAALALCAAQLFAAHTEVTTAPRLPFLRGMGFDGYYEGRNRTWMTQQGVYSGLVAKGFDHVRLPVDFRDYATYDSSTDTATLKETTSSWFSTGPGFSTFDTVITNAINAGLYITLDFHGWFDIDVTNTTQRAQFKAYWKAVAERYKDYPNKLIFELANEPRAPVGHSTHLNSLQKETISIIRQTNPTRLILYAVPDANQPWALTQAANPPKYGWVSYPTNDNNLALVIHSYNPGVFTHQGETWANPSYTNQVRLTNSHRTTLNWDLNQLTLYKKDHDIPIVMNEYNVSHKLADHGDVTEYLSIVTRYCESNGIPWSPWIYYAGGSGMDCFSSYGANASMIDYVEAGLFPDLKTTDKFSANDYPHAIDITFSGYSGSSALANFPVLVKLSESGIYGFHYSDFTKTNGFDLCFTDASGNLLAHEIDTWNPNGESTVWVKVPSLTASTKIVARYGCAKPIVPKVESVWDSNYVGVWHMGERKLPLADSSNVSRDVTSADGTGIGYGAAGIAGGAVNFGAANSSRCVNMDDHKELDGFKKLTVEAWTKQDAHATNAGIVSKRKASGNQATFYMFDNGSGTTMSYSTNGTTAVGSGVALSPVLGQWNHQVYSIDTTATASNSKAYLNGVNKGTANVTLTGGLFAGKSELHVGNLQDGNAANFPGQIDEVRISKCVRSADWVKASYETVAKANFATYAVQGVEPPEPDPEPVEYGPLATNLYAKSMNVVFAGAQDNVALTNFPVLVKLSTAISGFSYSDFTKANGGDLRFADANGTLLPHEIDTWNQSGVSTVWVKVPLLRKNTIVTAHYGFTGSGDPAPVAAKDVWDDDYVGVWHLGESALPLKESSETSSDFESSYGTTINYCTNGIVGHAVGFPAGGEYNSILAPDHDALDAFSKFTVEFWTFQKEHKHNAGILSKRKEYNKDCAYYFYDAINENNVGMVPFCIGTNANAGARWSFNLTQGMDQWNHIAYSADMASTTKNVHGFLNGTMNSWEPDVKFFGPMPNSAEPLVLGNLGANKKDYAFNGSIDEVRISKTVRSKEWVKATHDTIADAGFAIYSFGAVDYGDSITNLLLKAATDKDNPIDYVENENIRFDFRLDGVTSLPLEVRAKEPLHVIWTRTADDGVTKKGTNTISLAHGFSVTTKLAIPGIVKMTGTLVGSDYAAISYINPSDGKTKNITFGGGAGVATEKMQLTTVEPADFDQFWREAKQKLATVPFDDSNVELVNITPNSAANSYTIYAAKVPCFGPRPVTGWLTIPKNVPAGGLPIQASFDGYGCVSAIPKAPTWGYSTNVHFHINAHGYDLVNRDNQYYKDFNDYINKTNRTFNGQTYGYALAPQDYDNPTNTYFYYMAMRVMRAFDYLKSRPEWNGRDVIASGGSQGGLQTMWAGGLVDGITVIKPSITWGCDIGCPWNGKGAYPSRTWGIPSVAGAFYFDSALHAKRVPRTCIANITRLGMGDYTCPPRGVLLSYYNMKCAVSAKLVQGSDHGYVPPDPNQVFTISKAAQAEEYGPLDMNAYSKKMTVAFAGAQSGTALTNFPVLVRLSTAINGFSYSGFAMQNGGDLRFADADGNLIPHEIDTWNPAGESTVWVKVPLLTPAATITACYGCTNGTPPFVDSKDVWDDGYVGVWHLGESALPLADSTGASVNFDQSSGTVGFAAAGAAGGSVDFGTYNKKNLVYASDHDALDGFSKCTLEAWTYQTTHSQNSGILAKRGGYNNNVSYQIYDSGSSSAVVGLTMGTTAANGISSGVALYPALNSWNHLVYTFDSGTITGYNNGTATSPSSFSSATILSGNGKLCVGSFDQADSRNFPGKIDEVRISKVARSAAWVKATHDTIANADFATYEVEGAAEPDRILYVNVEGSTTTNTLDASLVTMYITNIVKQGTGVLIASPIPNYKGDFTIECGIFKVGDKDGAGTDKYANNIYVGPGASLDFSGKVGNILDNKNLVFEGEGASNAPVSAKFFNTGTWVVVGSGMSFTFKSDTKFACACWNRMIIRDADVDMGGHLLTLSCAPGNQIEFSTSHFRNPGNILVAQGMYFVESSGQNVFDTPSFGAGEIRLRNNSVYYGNGTVSAAGWTIVATNSGAKVGSNSSRFPNDAVNADWNGAIVFGKNSNYFVNYNGGNGNTKVSNTVFNVRGPISGGSGGGKLTVGPGWLNLHTSANNTYQGAVTVLGESQPSTSTIDYPIRPGGGGIGLWNGAACFPSASSVTFTNTARLAFMDSTACTVPNVKFITLADEMQSISGGVYTARSTIAGIVKEGAGTLVIDSPAQITGLADVKAGTLKVTYAEPVAATQEGVLAKMPQFASMKFASGTTFDLSDNVGFVIGDLDGSPCVTNSGLFGVTGKWTLNSPTDKLTVTGQNAMYGEQSAAGCLAFQGATFEIPSDKDAAFVAEAEAHGGTVEVARANWVVSRLDETTVLPMPTASAATNPRWSMAVGEDGQSVVLVLAPPASGYAAWIAGKGITGADAAAGKVTNGIANGVRYAFDIDPSVSAIGTPVIQVERDANGNPCVRARDLASGRDDVTFGILATEDLSNWNSAVLIPMKKFEVDSLWKPAASENNSSYVFPAKMFFKYKIDVE